MHTVEKIGGTSMSRFEEVLDNIFIGRREGVSAVPARLRRLGL